MRILTTTRAEYAPAAHSSAYLMVPLAFIDGNTPPPLEVDRGYQQLNSQQSMSTGEFYLSDPSLPTLPQVIHQYPHYHK